MDRVSWNKDLAAALRVVHKEMDVAVAWRLGVAVALVVAVSLLAGLAPLALKGVVDVLNESSAKTHAAITDAGGLALVYLVALCGGRLLSELRSPLIGSAEQHLYARIRRRYFGQVIDLPMRFHLGRHTGAVANGLEQAITGYQVLIFHMTSSIVPVLVELATVAFVLTTLGQPALVATFGATALAYLIVTIIHARRLDEGARAVSDANLGMHGMFTDALLNCETVKCFSAESVVQGRFKRSSMAVERVWIQLLRERTTFGLAAGGVLAAAMALSVLVSIDAVLAGTLSIGGFVMTNAYILQLVRPLEMLGTATRDLSQALAFVRPLLQVLEEPPEHSHVAAPSKAAENVDRSMTPGISFRNVNFEYVEGCPVLRNLSFVIAPEASVAIVGASGSGKSSLAKLIVGLHEPRSGDILVGKRSITAMPLSELRALIALVPQDTILFNDSIAFNIGIGKSGATRHDIQHAARIACLHDFITSLPAGYDTLVGERGLSLSGGQRQRVAIARAVLKRPRIYVFDEATSMLDTLTEREILRNLREVSAGCTTITIAHRLSTARQAEEIMVMVDGQVAERGRHEALLVNGKSYVQLWDAQLRDGATTVV